MAARAMGSAVISFGLVSLPVKLYSASESGTRVSFNLVHEKCGTRLKQQYICPTCEVVVPRDEMVKGYEFAKGQYVLFPEDELKALETPPSESIDIKEFVPADQVDRLYFDRGYYLGPDRGGARAYRLLAAALEETNRVAIAKYAARGKQYLVMLRPKDEGLVMEQLHYADEMKPFSEVPVEGGEVNDAELNLARQLIDQAASEEFKPEAYHDEMRERMLEMIQRKVEGEEITMAPAEAPQTQIIDLMAALKASLAAGDKDAAPERKPASRAKKPASRKKAEPKKKASSG